MAINNKGALTASAKELLAPYQKRVEEIFEKDIVSRYGESEVIQACRYAFGGGKKLRPSIVFSIAQALDPGADVDKVAVAVECFHVLTLIVDDLPCLDNDSIRRDRPSTHIAFSERVALLANYALVGYVYCLVQENPIPKGVNPSRVLKAAIEHVSAALGYSGIVTGQYMDTCSCKYTREEIQTLSDKKTGALFALSFVLGWLYGGGDIEKLDRVKEMAKYFGRAFQYTDDIDDLEQDAKASNWANYALSFGLEETEALIQKYSTRFLDIAQELGIDKTPVARLAQVMGEVAGKNV